MASGCERRRSVLLCHGMKSRIVCLPAHPRGECLRSVSGRSRRRTFFDKEHPTPMLTVQNLTLTHKKDLVSLIEGLSFSVHPGERLALIGEEGNGKSSLLRAILGDPSLDAYLEVRGRIVNTFRTGYLPQ